jgi:hypothetical protein
MQVTHYCDARQKTYESLSDPEFMRIACQVIPLLDTEIGLLPCENPIDRASASQSAVLLIPRSISKPDAICSVRLQSWSHAWA